MEPADMEGRHHKELDEGGTAVEEDIVVGVAEGNLDHRMLAVEVLGHMQALHRMLAEVEECYSSADH
jgi:hypothetical protein